MQDENTQNEPAEPDTYASGAETGDDTALQEKLANQDQGPAVVAASEVSSLGYTDDDVDPSAGGSDQVQARIDEENEHGLRGVKVDPTPNENYTVAGVTSGAPTPETDQSLREDIRKARKLDGPEPLV